MNVDKLFDYINFFFLKSNEYHKLNSNQKAKHHYMLNRFMSIQYPLTASKLNKIGINGAYVSDSWQLVARQYKSIPKWIYTKTKKTSENALDKLDKDLLKEYARINKISSLDMKNLEAFYFNDLKAELKLLEKQINTSRK